MANFSDDPYDLLDDEEELKDPEEEDQDDADNDPDAPDTPENEDEANPLGGGSAPVKPKNTEEGIEDIIGNPPEPSKPFDIADEIEKDEKAKYDIPPDGADIPEKKASELDELEEPTAKELEEIELEEEFGGKD